MSWSLAVLIGLTGGAGAWLLMHRSLTRVVLGLGLMVNAVNLVALSSGGPPGSAPIVGRDGPLADPVPQALVLTAIVIGLGVSGFLLATALRSWTIDGNDDVEDDLEDRRLAAAASTADEPEAVSDSEFPTEPLTAEPPGEEPGEVATR